MSLPPPLPPMKRVLSFSDKVCLWLGLGLVGALLLGALGWAAVRNIQADNARIEREEGERAAAERLEAARKYEAQVAFWKTPEGKKKREEMEVQAKRVAEQNAVADAEIEKMRWAPWQRVAKAFQEAGLDVRPSTEPKAIRAVVPFELAQRMTGYEIKALCQMAYNALGEGAFVQMKDPAGVLLGQADGWSVKAYK